MLTRYLPWAVVCVLAVLAVVYSRRLEQEPAPAGEHGKQFEVVLSEEEWRARLTEEQFRVLRGGRTDRIGSGAYLKTTEEGLYLCAGCENPLFRSETKYDSGTGWPSFWAPIDTQNIHMVSSMVPSEVLCGRCGGHLGHVFSNGPPPTGLRYCINSVALQFQTKQ